MVPTNNYVGYGMLSLLESELATLTRAGRACSHSKIMLSNITRSRFRIRVKISEVKLKEKLTNI